jgi:hypothetical protein
MRLDKCLWSFDVSKILTVKKEFSDDSADERRNASEY